MNLYSYEGSVLMFGEVIDRNWRGSTWAQSEKKAMSNFKYQYKKGHGYVASTKIELPGTIKLEVTAKDSKAV